nr:protein KRI1 homolog [Coffea arabica]
MGLKLFDSDSSSEDDEKLNRIEINQEFARRYEHNKKREDLQRLEELKKKGVIDSESDSEESSSEQEEEEENANLSKKKDLEFFDALIRVRNKDPILKDKEAKLFQSELDSENEEDDDNDNDGNGNSGSEEKGNKLKKDGKRKEKKKPMYLKDVASKQLIEEGPEFDDDDDEEKDNVDKKVVKSYAEEQEELRKAFLQAVEDAEAEEGDDGEEFLIEKRKRDGEDEESEEDVGFGEKLDEYFGGDEKLDEDMMFLKDYFRNRMWVGNGDHKKGVGDEEGLGVSADEEEIERQEDYERDYNFRFEENAGDRVMGHSRVVEGSVRKKTNARKVQRLRKEERMAQAEFERREELKHLKNVKKKEMMEKLRKLRKAAGIGDDGAWLLDEDDLEEEFNPDEYDKKMKEAFDDGYYKADDVDPEFGSDHGEDNNEFEKPDFAKEDELLGLPEGWDDIRNACNGFLSTRERILQLKTESGDNHEQSDEEDARPEDGKRKKKRKRHASEVEKALRDEFLEEYYKLDYEDTIGDLKTKFHYREVPPNRYGLNPEEILVMDNKELNQYVPIKKLAPYREKEWKVPRIKAYQQRQRIKEVKANVSTVPKNHKLLSDSRNVNSAVSSAESEKPWPAESNGDTSKLSRRSKRRHRQAELKLSHSRLMAYGKIPSKTKSKKKSSVQDVA